LAGSPDFTSIRYCSGGERGVDAGGDLRERIAGQLRADDRGPRRAAHGEILKRPQAGERQRLQTGHGGQPAGRQLVEVVPGAEDVDQARRDEVERDAGHREPEHAPSQPVRRLGLGRRAALDLVLDVRPLIDRALDAIADLGHRRPAYGSPG
jgi:hypothetical protein